MASLGMSIGIHKLHLAFFFVMMPCITIWCFAVFDLFQLFRRKLCSKLRIIFYGILQLPVALVKLLAVGRLQKFIRQLRIKL